MTAPAPTPWIVATYSPSPGVDGFQGLPRYGSSTFPADDIGNQTYWIDVLISAGIPVVCFIVGLLAYWFFLCCRSGCCSKCCARCQTCTDILFGCGCKQLCCPKVNRDLAVFDGSYPKSPNHCIHKPLCKGSPHFARLFLIIIFIAVGMVNLQVDTGLNEVKNAFHEVADVCDTIADTFDDFITAASELEVSAANITDGAEGLEATCTDNLLIDTAETVVTYADEVSSAAGEIDDTIGNLPKTMRDAGKAVRNAFSGTNYAYTRYALMIAILFSVLGFVSAICFESTKSCCCRFASSLLSLTTTLGIFLMLILALAVVVETYLGLVVSDFCYADPSEVLVTISADQLGQEPADTLEFFLLCNQENPVDEYYDEAMDAAQDINTTLASMKMAATADQLCCSEDAIDDYNDISDLNSNCYRSNCDVNSGVCTLPDTSSGYCVEGSQCNLNDYNTVQRETNYVLGNNGPLEEIYNLLACQTVNEPITRLLNVALCDHAIDGIYLLWQTHVGVLMAIYVAIILISYLRQAIVGQPCFGGQPVEKSRNSSSAEFQVPGHFEEGEVMSVEVTQYSKKTKRESAASSNLDV